MTTNDMSAYHQSLRDLSDSIVRAQRKIRVLDACKWGPEIEQAFFDSGCKVLPAIDKDYYTRMNPLPFDPKAKIEEFYAIEQAIRHKLGQFNPMAGIMQRMCREYIRVVQMLEARGETEFHLISQELYGSSGDAFHAGAPTLHDLATTVTNTLSAVKKTEMQTDLDKKRYTSVEAVEILDARLKRYFNAEPNKSFVILSDDIVADAAAGAECIKVRSNRMFSERELNVLEVHEGWVHLATTLNGLKQPICTFLSKGPPSSTITQEGLAIIMEVFTFASFPSRVQRLTDRISAIHMAENGADFIEVFRFFCERGLKEKDAFAGAMRTFRGSTPTGKPFTKDLSYSKGFILIYNFVRLAIQKGLLTRIPLLFIGKITLEDIQIYETLLDEKIVTAPTFVPPQFKDLAALTAWMSYSLFLNQLNLTQFAHDFKGILQ